VDEPSHVDAGLDAIRQSLEPDESLIWTGRPDPGVQLVQIACSQVFAGLLLVLITAFWIIPVVRGGSNTWDRGKEVVPSADLVDVREVGSLVRETLGTRS
jgi:hypothetical protein